MLLTEFDNYRKSHLLHHYKIFAKGDPTVLDLPYKKNLTRLEYAAYLLSPLVLARISRAIRYYARNEQEQEISTNTRRTSRKNKRTIRFVLGAIGAQTLLAFLATWGGQVPQLFLLFPVSVATVTMFLSRLRTFSEHGRIDELPTNEFTRSHLPSLVDAAFVYDANFNWHLEHHIYPRMPSCNLRLVFEAFGKIYHNKKTLGSSMVATLTEPFRF